MELAEELAEMEAEVVEVVEVELLTEVVELLTEFRAGARMRVSGSNPLISAPGLAAKFIRVQSILSTGNSKKKQTSRSEVDVTGKGSASKKNTLAGRKLSLIVHLGKRKVVPPGPCSRVTADERLGDLHHLGHQLVDEDQRLQKSSESDGRGRA